MRPTALALALLDRCRQFPLGNDIADFAAPAAKLAVEVDGAHHARQQAADARRDRNLRRLGYRVLRCDEGCTR